MKYVSEKYQKTLDDLAEKLVVKRGLGDAALQDTIEFEPVVLPPGLHLCEPPEHGYYHDPPPAA